MSINVLVIGGHLTRDPETRFLSNETQVTKVCVAVNRRYRTKEGEQKEEVVFLDVEAWRGTANYLATYAEKGSYLEFTGRLKQDAWEDKNGNKRNKIFMVADSAQIVTGWASKEDNQSEQKHAPKPQSNAESDPQELFTPKDDEDEPPF